MTLLYECTYWTFATIEQIVRAREIERVRIRKFKPKGARESKILTCVHKDL